VPTDSSGQVLEFLEKPTKPEEIVTDQINAGCYVFKRSIIDRIASDRPVSVERETFPELLSSQFKVIGVVDDGYWLDLGTPLAFAKGSADLVMGVAPSPLVQEINSESKIENTAIVDATSQITAGSYIGKNVRVGKNCLIKGSVIFDQVVIEDGVTIENSIVSTDSVIKNNNKLSDAVIGERVVIEPNNELFAGVRVFPDAKILSGNIRFSSDKS
jgi:mannose-1-phosphate guanylyltransferase